jgi:uridine kinase
MSQNLQDVVGKNNLIMLNGDDAHKWERSDNNWQIFTHLNPSANKLHTDAEHLYALIDGNSIERVLYNHKTGKFNKPKVLKNNQHILFQGLHPFILENMRPIYDLKIYVEAEEKLRIKWKLERDTKKRGHSSVQVKNEIKRRTSDAKKFIYPQKQFADWIIYYNTFKGNLRVNNSFKNSVPLDAVAQELAQIPSLQLSVSYLDMNYQQLNYYGSVKKSTIERIAYKLYPNLNELFNNYPTFHHDIKGIQQLLFINYINFYYIQKQRNNGRFY